MPVARNLSALSDSKFDLIVIGGGIYGTTIALDATLRGLSVAIIDQGDFGSGTSFNSAKTVHGGVRSLQRGNLREMNQFINERRTLSRLLPHLVTPLPFVIPTYQTLTRNKWLMRPYFSLYDRLSSNRNNQIDRSLRLPDSRFLSRNECLELNPMISPTKVTGGIQWFDCQMYNSDRVNLSFVLSAMKHGATAANYVEAESLIYHKKQIVGLRVLDRLGNSHFDLHGKIVLNCTGPWTNLVLKKLLPKRIRDLPFHLSKAMNFVTNKPVTTTHALGSWNNGRLLFIAPWRDRSIIGTSHHLFAGDADTLKICEHEVEDFLRQVNSAFPNAKLQMDDLQMIHCGLLPAVTTVKNFDSLLKTSLIVDHTRDGVSGLLSVVGVRYTTARDTAEHAVDVVFKLLKRKSPTCRTDNTTLFGGEIPDIETFFQNATQESASNLSESTCLRLARSYGSNYATLLAELHKDPASTAKVAVDSELTVAEVQHSVKHEMAVKLSDVVLRRTELGSGGHPGIDALRSTARLMGGYLGWSSEQMEKEISEVENLYDFQMQ